jgi:hypothetical protein
VLAGSNTDCTGFRTPYSCCTGKGVGSCSGAASFHQPAHIGRNYSPGFDEVRTDLDSTHSRPAGEVQGRLATEIARVFSFPYLGLDRIRHSIEPEVQYLFSDAPTPERLARRLRRCQIGENPDGSPIFFEGGAGRCEL